MKQHLTTAKAADNKQRRILYLVPHRFNRSPGQRFRCEHFIPYVEDAGYKITYSNALSKWDDYYFYSYGKYLIKLFIVAKVFCKRLLQILQVKKYDIVFIYREAFMLGTVFFERLARYFKIPIIFDFDDSIWLNDTSQGNQNLKWMKRPGKTADICKIANAVIVGNKYLSDYAKQYNNNTCIIPTTINVKYHTADADKIEKEYVTIGWTGTRTTLKHFYLLKNVFKNLQTKYGNKIRYKVIADIPPAHNCEDIDIEFVEWNKESEIAQLASIDIGIMPLPDDEWAKGKCGFKGLQYMALSIPTIMSPVGVNTEIIEHGKNGYLASTEGDWLQLLSGLIENPDLRQKLGKMGRKTIEDKFTVEYYKDKYINIFNSCIKYNKIQNV